MATNIAPVTARQEWSRHWVVPLVSTVGLAVSVTHLYSFGVFIPSLEREFGWSRAQTSSGLTVLSVLSVLLAPYMGHLIDRFGSRMIALPGIALYCLALAGVSLASHSIWTWWLAWLIVAPGLLSVKPTVWTAAIASHFDQGRGMAIAVALCGTGIGSSLFPFVTTILVEDYGWRGGFVGLAVLDAVIALPLVWLFFFDANDKRRREGRQGGRQNAVILPGIALRDVLTSSRFYRLALVSLLFATSTTAFIIHFVPILTDGGLTLKAAAATAGLIGLSSLVGRLSAGAMLDRFSGPKVGFACFALPISVCVLLLLPPSQALSIVIAILLGLSFGSELDVVAYLATRYFGMRHFGVVFGTIAGLQILGSGLGPLVAGFVHDQTGNYALLPLMALPLFAACAIMTATLGRYPVFAVDTAKEIEALPARV